MNEKNIDKVLDRVELYVSTLGISAFGVLTIFCGGFALGQDFIYGLPPFIASTLFGWNAIRYGWKEFKERRPRHEDAD